MSQYRIGFGIGITLLALTGQQGLRAGETPGGENEPLIVRLIHPDRQAAEVLRLFEGSRVANPAAALSAWKRSAGNGGQLGKPLEALIAMFNPEMVREYRVLDGTEIQLGLNPADGSPRWFAIIPHDDGTVAAALTASRLTYPDDERLREQGREIAVARLGRSGGAVASRLGSNLILASSRPDLLRGIPRIKAPPGDTDKRSDLRRKDSESAPFVFDAESAKPEESVRPGGPGGQEQTAALVAGHPLDSGLFFRLDAGRMTTPRAGSLGLRRAIEALRATNCRRAEGALDLRDGRLTLEVATTFEERAATRGVVTRPPVIDPAWLDHFPASNAMAFMSVAVDPAPAFWDVAFALADRVERADPARSGVAPLRARLNLMAAAAGVKPEADLLPHLRGVSACLWGDPGQPGRPVGALLILHLDDEPNARRLAREFVPRLASLLTGRRIDEDTPRPRPIAEDVGGAPPGKPLHPGLVLGRKVTVWWQNRDTMIAWGDDAFMASLGGQVPQTRSLAAVYRASLGEGRGAPQRFGAVWPGRLWHPGGGSHPRSETMHAFADDPPVVWCGWIARDRAYDLLRWPDLAVRVRRVPRNDPPRPIPDPVRTPPRALPSFESNLPKWQIHSGRPTRWQAEESGHAELVSAKLCKIMI